MKKKDQPSKTPGQKVILYDGLCTMCKGLANSLDNSSKKSSFKMSDLTSDELPTHVTREAAEKEIHVIDEDGTIYKNSEAVLKILEEFPRFAWLVRTGRWPVIRQILAVGYAFVARNRHFIAGPAGRLYWTKMVLGLGFMTGILISLPLWLSERQFPVVPLASGLTMPHPFDYLLVGGLLASLAAIVLSGKPRRYILAFTILLAVTAAFDQMRWQPWAYQYAAMLVAIGLFRWRASDKAGIQTALNTCRLIVASIYIMSGLHKFNASFVLDVFPWMLLPVTKLLPPMLDELLYVSAVFVPIVEAGIGIALLTQRFRKLAVIAAIGMHLTILALLGPIGLDWNGVVWPWNLAMIAFVALLFWNVTGVSLGRLLWNRRSVYHTVVLVLFGILPLLSMAGLYDKYLSSALYSGDTTTAYIRVSERQWASLPEAAREVTTKRGGKLEIPVTDWSLNAVRTPPYPEARIYKSVARQLCEKGTTSLELVLLRNPAPLQTAYAEKYSCADLL